MQRMTNLWRFICSITVLLSTTTLAENTQPLSAEASDPKVMGWMQGYPLAAEKRIEQPDSNYFSFPKLRWSVCHLREFLPTREISRGVGNTIPLQYLPDMQFSKMRDQIDALTFTPLNSDNAMTWEQSLYENYTDGMLVIHKGRVVYERYFGCLDERGQHAAMSMTKSVTGLIAEILIAKGVLNEDALVKTLVPEIGDSAFANATVREVMNMTTGVAFSENYADPNADIWRYSKAASPFPRTKEQTGPNGYWEYLQQLNLKANTAHFFTTKQLTRTC